MPVMLMLYICCKVKTFSEIHKVKKVSVNVRGCQVTENLYAIKIAQLAMEYKFEVPTFM